MHDVDPILAAAVHGYQIRLDQAREMWIEGAISKRVPGSGLTSRSGFRLPRSS